MVLDSYDHKRSFVLSRHIQLYRLGLLGWGARQISQFRLCRLGQYNSKSTFVRELKFFVVIANSDFTQHLKSDIFQTNEMKVITENRNFINLKILTTTSGLSNYLAIFSSIDRARQGGARGKLLILNIFWSTK